MPASDDFAKLYAQLARREARIGAVLKKRQAEFLRKANVVGVGVGRKGAEPAVVFLVRRKVPNAQLPPKDRIPAWILVGGKRVPTVVQRVGTPRLAAAIGDPTENRKSYRIEGIGDWKMGTQIRVFLPGPGGGLQFEGTSGALVRDAKDASASPLVLSCGHVFVQPPFDVAQAEKNREPPKWNNFAGAVLKIADFKKEVDAGVAECGGPLKEILNVGAPRPPQKPIVGLNVQKSGRTTGLTFSSIAVTGTAITPTDLGFKLAGLFAVKNECKQDPDKPGALEPKVPADRFGFRGDSGALIVIGRPGTLGDFGTEDLQKTYTNATDDEKEKMLETYERAALGLLVAYDDKYVYGQEIDLALKALDVTLVT